MSIIKYFKNRKLEKKNIEAEIENCIKEGKYIYAGILAENSRFRKLKKLADKYYNIGSDRLKEESWLEFIKKIKLIPSKECHQNLLDHLNLIEMTEYSLDNYYIRN